MGLTWRDAITTLLMAFVVSVALAVTKAWGWPMLGGYRAGTAVLAAAGLTMCIVGGSTIKTQSAKDPFIALASVLGAGAFALAIAGLLTGARSLFVAVAADIVVLWIVATVRHAVRRRPRYEVEPAQLAAKRSKKIGNVSSRPAATRTAVRT